MARRRRPDHPLTIESPRAIHALASAHRLETIAALGDAGPSSIAELARRLGRTPHSLYYHMRRLEEAGVVRAIETRRRGRRDERVWELAATRILLASGATQAGSAAQACGAADAMLRLTSRELQAAIRREHERRGADQPVIGLRMKGRFEPSALERIQRLVHRIESIVRRSHQTGSNGQVCALTVVLAPIESKSRREDQR